MKSHSLLFMGEMVRATLNTQPGVWPARPIDPTAPYKWQTRRTFGVRNCLVDGWRPKDNVFWKGLDWSNAYVDNGPSPTGNPGPYLRVSSPAEETVHRVYPVYDVGDELWGKETFCFGKGYDGLKPREVEPPFVKRHYMADGPKPDWAGQTRPSIFLPQRYSRINGVIKRIRIERVQDINEEDSEAEGIQASDTTYGGSPLWRDYSGLDRVFGVSPIESYKSLWDSINADRAPWSSNPWVIVIDYMRKDVA